MSRLTEKLYINARAILSKEPRLIKLPSEGEVVFVGDTHGDIEASRKVFREFFTSNRRIVFLGDYVDRGPKSKENIVYLLCKKIRYPDRVFLLLGNHEGYQHVKFEPANFWESLRRDEKMRFFDLFLLLPLAAYGDNGIIALHGGLPDIDDINDINQIEIGDENWRHIVWGDFLKEYEEKDTLISSFFGRPQLQEGYFLDVMKRLNKQILIRSHQPYMEQSIYSGRCLTIFTSMAYGETRTIAIVDMEKPVNTIEDVKIVNI